MVEKKRIRLQSYSKSAKSYVKNSRHLIDILNIMNLFFLIKVITGYPLKKFFLFFTNLTIRIGYQYKKQKRDAFSAIANSD